MCSIKVILAYKTKTQKKPNVFSFSNTLVNIYLNSVVMCLQRPVITSVAMQFQLSLVYIFGIVDLDMLLKMSSKLPFKIVMTNA